MQALFITHFANGTKLPPAMQYDKKVSEALPPQQPKGSVSGNGPASSHQVRVHRPLNAR